jgi:hypothetical protein
MALVTGPIVFRVLADTLGEGVQKATAGWKKLGANRIEAIMAAGVFAVAGFVAFGLDVGTPWLGGAARPNAGFVGSAYPVGATQFLARAQPQGNLYNTFHFGGYLLYHLGPAMKVFVDGRTANVYDDAHMRDVMHIRDEWPRVFEKWNVQVAVTQHGEVEEALGADPRWTLVFFDDLALVFVRNDGVNAELARRNGYHDLIPPFRTPHGQDLARLKVETERVVAESPSSALAHILRGRVRGQQNDVVGFELDMRAAVVLDPSRPEPWQRLGLLALGRGHKAEAVQDLSQALELRPDSVDLRFATAAAEWSAGDESAALETLRPLVATQGRSMDSLFADLRKSPLLESRQ